MGKTGTGRGLNLPIKGPTTTDARRGRPYTVVIDGSRVWQLRKKSGVCWSMLVPLRHLRRRGDAKPEATSSDCSKTQAPAYCLSMSDAVLGGGWRAPSPPGGVPGCLLDLALSPSSCSYSYMDHRHSLSNLHRLHHSSILVTTKSGQIAPFSIQRTTGNSHTECHLVVSIKRLSPMWTPHPSPI